MDVRPLTQTRQDFRRRRYAVADKSDEEVGQDVVPETPTLPASWSAPSPRVGMMTTAHWLAVRQTISPEPE